MQVIFITSGVGFPALHLPRRCGKVSYFSLVFTGDGVTLDGRFISLQSPELHPFFSLLDHSEWALFRVTHFCSLGDWMQVELGFSLFLMTHGIMLTVGQLIFIEGTVSVFFQVDICRLIVLYHQGEISDWVVVPYCAWMMSMQLFPVIGWCWGHYITTVMTVDSLVTPFSWSVFLGL